MHVVKRCSSVNTVHFTLLWPVHTYSIDMQGAFWDAYIDMYERSVLFNSIFSYILGCMPTQTWEVTNLLVGNRSGQTGKP